MNKKCVKNCKKSINRWAFSGLLLILSGCMSTGQNRREAAVYRESSSVINEVMIDKAKGQKTKRLLNSFLYNDELVVFVNPTQYEGTPKVSSSLIVRDQATGKQQSLPITNTQIHADVHGCAATVHFVQEFSNQCTGTSEGTYYFPLGGNGSLTDFIMTVGERRIRGIIRKSSEAELIYKQAKQQGYKVTLVTQEVPNLFIQKFTNLNPGSDIKIDLTYFQKLWYNSYEKNYQLKLPIQTNPSLVSPSEAPPTLRNGQNLTIQIDLHSDNKQLQYTASHKISSALSNLGTSRIKLTNTPKIANKDFLLKIKSATRQFPRIIIDSSNGKNTFMLQLPPATPYNSTTPTLKNMRINWGGLKVKNLCTSRKAETKSTHPLTICGEFTNQLDTLIEIMYYEDSKKVQLSIPVVAKDFNHAHPAIRQLWAYQKLKSMIVAQLENKHIDKQSLIAFSIKHKILSPFTALMAVDTMKKHRR